MKCLSIQLQPELDTHFTTDDLIQHLRLMGRYPEIDRDPKNSKYTNLNLFTEELPKLSQEINDGLLNDPHIGSWVKNVAVIVAEGENGWDNCLLIWDHKAHKGTI
ncbi:MAG: hypothetical protein K6L81_15875 [Agarilytica sp.]